MMQAHNTGESFVAVLWEDLYNAYSPGLLEVIFLTAIQLLFFWVPATILLMLDLTFPKFSSRHKIQSERRQPTWPQIKHCIVHVAANSVNGTLVQLLAAYLLGFQRSLYRVSPILPSSKEIALDFILACVVREVMFYYSHRLLHHPNIYKSIHKWVKVLHIFRKSLNDTGNITNSRPPWHLQRSMHIRSNT